MLAGLSLDTLLGPQESSTTDDEYLALQIAAANNGEALGPSTLRLMILRELAAAADAGRSLDAGGDGSPGSVKAAPVPGDGAWSAQGGGGSLSSLPDELLLVILACCDAPTLTVLSVVSRELAALARTDALWHALVVSRYGAVREALPPHALKPRATWCALYKSLGTPGHSGSFCSLVASRHASDESCWLVLEEAVYDVTEFMHRHPGMATPLRLFGGTDATEAFREVPHSSEAMRFMATLEVRERSLTRACGMRRGHGRATRTCTRSRVCHAGPMGRCARCGFRPSGLRMSSSWAEAGRRTAPPRCSSPPSRSRRPGPPCAPRSARRLGRTSRPWRPCSWASASPTSPRRRARASPPSDGGSARRPPTPLPASVERFAWGGVQLAVSS